MKKTNLVTFASLVLICICTTALSAATIIVDPNENNPADYTTIQEAIDNSINGDIIELVPGTYYENINFNGLAITVTGTNPDDMAIVYSTVINGGLSGDTVTFATDESSTSVLTGVTVENGSVGINCTSSSPTIKKCVIRNSKSGDGIQGLNASPAIMNCIIRKNKGDGIYSCDGHITDCSVEENTGNGISNCDGPIQSSNIIANGSSGLYKCNGEINGCSIKGNGSHGINECDGNVKNSAIQGNNGSGIYFADGTEVYNCIISGNSTYGIGYIYGLVTNCTIVGNVSQGIATTSSTSTSLTVTISNNIIANNDAYGIYQVRSGTTVNVINNNVFGNTTDHYNSYLTAEETATDIHVDPVFAIDGSWDIDGYWVDGDYHLKSIAGRLEEGIWVNDTETSPCIDAGDPASIFSIEPAPNGGIINQGAYGGTAAASKSPFGEEAYCTQAIPGDVNGDCKLNLEDLAVISSHWLECNLEPASACFP